MKLKHIPTLVGILVIIAIILQILGVPVITSVLGLLGLGNGSGTAEPSPWRSTPDAPALLEWTPAPYPEPESELPTAEAVFQPQVLVNWTEADVLLFTRIMQGKFGSMDVDLSVLHIVYNAFGAGIRCNAALLSDCDPQLSDCTGEAGVDSLGVASLVSGNFYAGTAGRLEDSIRITMSLDTETWLSGTPTSMGGQQILDRLHPVRSVEVVVPWGITNLEIGQGGGPRVRTFNNWSVLTQLLFVPEEWAGYDRVADSQDMTTNEAIEMSKLDALWRFVVNRGRIDPTLVDLMGEAVLRRLSPEGDKFAAILAAANQAAAEAGGIAPLPGLTDEQGNPVYVTADMLTVRLDGPYWLASLDPGVPDARLAPPDLAALFGHNDFCPLSELPSEVLDELLYDYRDFSVEEP